MKRIFCLLLSFAMIFSLGITSAFATEFTDVSNTEHEIAIQTLADLNVINGYQDGTFKPDQQVSRAEMAALLVRALGYGNMASNLTTTAFTDVPKENWASGYIAFANGIGLIAGYGNGKYGPSDPVTYDQVITMVVRALGYTEETLKGGYPMGYIYKAAQLDILDNVKTGNIPAPRGTIAQILYNALNTEIVEVTTSPVLGVVNIKTNTNDTMLKRLGASTTKAVLTYTDATKINLIDKIGEYCEIYKDQKGNVIAASSLADTITGEVKSGKFVVGDTSYTIKSTAYADAMTFVNGAKTDVELTSGNINNYTVLNCEISGNYITKIYSASKWVGVTVQATKSTVENLKKNKINSYTFDTTNKDEINVNSFILNGVSSVEDIVAGDIITIYTYNNNSSNDIIRLDVASDIISGVVNRIKSGTNTTYTINGHDYELATDVSPLVIGVEYKCYLDYTGKVFKYERLTSAAKNIGVFVASSEETAFENAKIGYYTFNKTSGTTVSELTCDIPSGVVEGTMFTYTTDKYGAINEITKAISGTDSTLNGSIMIIDDDYYRIAKDAKVFTYADGTIGTSTLDKVDKKTALGRIQFIVDSDDTIVAIMIGAIHADAETGTGYCVINDISTVATDKGSVREINGYVDGVKTVFNTVSTSTIETADAHTLYKMGYSGSDVKTLKTVTPTAIATNIVTKDGEFIKGEEGIWNVLSETAIIYEYDADEQTYTLTSHIPYGVTVYLYDISTSADSIYDVVIWTETVED